MQVAFFIKCLDNDITYIWTTAATDKANAAKYRAEIRLSNRHGVRFMITNLTGIVSGTMFGFLSGMQQHDLLRASPLIGLQAIYENG